MVVILPVSLRLRVPCCLCPLSHLVSNQDGHFPSEGTHVSFLLVNRIVMQPIRNNSYIYNVIPVTA